MDAIKIGLIGDRQAGLRFEEFPDVLYEDLRKAIDSLTNELFARVQAATPELTGDLRAHERVRIFTDENRITGYVDVHGSVADIKKAAAVEYGAHKTTNVKSHSMKLDHFWNTALTAPIDVIVIAYSRTPNVAEVAFDDARLLAIAPEIDMLDARRHLEVIPRLCVGDSTAGPIAGLSQSERFNWLIAPRSAMIQMSSVHSGIADDPTQVLKKLMSSMVVRSGKGSR